VIHRKMDMFYAHGPGPPAARDRIEFRVNSNVTSTSLTA